jgi:hypothetical protein
MKHLLHVLCILIAASTAAAQTTPIVNSRVTGNMDIKSGATLKIESGATFTFESGATFLMPDGLIAFSKVTGAAPASAKYIVQSTDSTLTGEQSLGALASGIVYNTTTSGTGVLSTLTLGAGLSLSDGELSATGFANPLTTEGDLVVGGAAGAPTRLAIGAAGQVLKVTGPGTLAWASDSTGSGALPEEPVAGDVVYFDGDNWVPLPLGDEGHVLTAGASAPEWAAPTGGSGGGTKTLIQWSALSAQLPASNFATFDTRNSIVVLDFDASTAETAVFVGIIPEGADLSAGLAVRLIWMATTAITGDVMWESAIERGNTDLDSDSFGTAKTTTTTTSGTSGIPVTTTINHDAAEIDGVLVGELVRVRVRRVAADSADTMSGDAELIALELRSR